MPKPGTRDYFLAAIPLELWEAAQAKAKALRPPQPMRRVLLELLTRWVEPPPQDRPKPLQPPIL